jgi:hypothetical protein
MIRLLADDNLHFALVQGVRRQHPEIDFVSVHEVGQGAGETPKFWNGPPSTTGFSLPTMPIR